MRLFCSINFDQETRDQITAVQKNLKKMSQGRFPTEDSFHITLAFLGDVEKKRMPGLKAALDSLNVPEMELTFDRVGSFRSEEKLVWLGIRKNPQLLQVQKQLLFALEENGFHLNGSKFTPHITLGRRMDAAVHYEQLQVVPFCTKVCHVCLMKSDLSGPSPKYTEIYRV